MELVLSGKSSEQLVYYCFVSCHDGWAMSGLDFYSRPSMSLPHRTLALIVQWDEVVACHSSSVTVSDSDHHSLNLVKHSEQVAVWKASVNPEEREPYAETRLWHIQSKGKKEQAMYVLYGFSAKIEVASYSPCMSLRWNCSGVYSCILKNFWKKWKSWYCNHFKSRIL